MKISSGVLTKKYVEVKYDVNMMEFILEIVSDLVASVKALNLGTFCSKR